MLCLGFAAVSGAAAGLGRDVRYSGLSAMYVTIDTADINATALANADRLGSGLLIVGGESLSGERDGWIAGGFAGTGSLAGESRQAELTLNIAGLSIERIFHTQSGITFVAGAGNARLQYTSAAAMEDWDDFINHPHTNTASSVFWFVQPSAGLRLQVADYLVIEAKLGLGMSMSDGRWKQGTNSLPGVSYKIGGPSLMLGVKAGIF